MEKVLTQIPGHKKWSKDFMNYINCLKLDICEEDDEASLCSRKSLGPLQEAINSQVLIKVARYLDE